nr:uncharacterized protein LOC109158743 [Ipomoea batatas]
MTSNVESKSKSSESDFYTYIYMHIESVLCQASNTKNSIAPYCDSRISAGDEAAGPSSSPSVGDVADFLFLRRQLETSPPPFFFALRHHRRTAAQADTSRSYSLRSPSMLMEQKEEDGITEIDTEEQNECEEVLSIPEGENNRLNKQGNLGGKGKRPAVIVSENQIMGQKEQPPQMHIGGAESSKNKDRVNRGIKGRTSNQAAASDEHTVVIATDHGNKVTRTTVNINKEGPMMHGVLELNMNEHHNDPPNGDDVHMVDSTVIANGSVGSGTSPVGLNASLA